MEAQPDAGLLATLIEEAPVAIAMLDSELRYIAVSRRWRTEYALGDQPLVGRCHYEVFPDLPERWRDAHRRGLAGQTLHVGGDPWSYADGSVRYMNWEASPWRTADGAVGGLILVTRDDTPRVQTEQALQRAEEHARMALGAARAGTWEYRPESGQLLLDERCAALHGMPGAVVVTLDMLMSAVHEFDRTALAATLRATLENALPGVAEYRVGLAAGQERWLVAQMQRSGLGAAHRLVGLVEDVTDRKQAEAALRQAKERFEATIAASSVVVFSQDRELRYTWVHNHPQGFDTEHVRGLRDRDLFPRTADAVATEELKWQVLETGRSGRREVRFWDGAVERVYDLLVQPQRDERQRIVGVVCVAIDLTERRQAEDRLVKRTAQLDLLARLSQVLIVRGANDDTLTDVFSQMASAIGVESFFYYRADESVRLLALAVSGGISESERRRFAVIRYGEMLCGRVAETQRRIIVEDLQSSTEKGSEGLVGLGATSYAGFPLAVRGALLGTLAFVSNRRQHLMEGDLQMLQMLCDQIAVVLNQERLLSESMHANRMKDEFLAMLAHELRNPLAAIGNAGEVLKNGGIELPRAQRALAILNRQARHLSSLVDDLLDIARIAQGRIQLKSERVDVRQCIEQAVELMRPLLVEKRHSLTVQMPGEPLWVMGDPDRLAQVFCNVLQNAAKYTADGGDIRLSGAKEDGAVQVAIEDNGSGIAPELLPHVFDLFVQSERTLDRAQGGLGVGLAVVRGLIEKHHGSIRASSAGIGRGSVFTIRLPACDDARSIGAAVDGEGRVTARDKLRILVVDDIPDVAETFELLLHSEGHEVTVVRTGSDALAQVRANCPDVVFLDIGLPGMDGHEVARRIRAMDLPAAPAIVAVTGYGQPEDQRRTGVAGCDAHLIKPVQPQVLIALLDKIGARRGPGKAHAH